MKADLDMILWCSFYFLLMGMILGALLEENYIGEEENPYIDYKILETNETVSCKEAYENYCGYALEDCKNEKEYKCVSLEGVF